MRNYFIGLMRGERSGFGAQLLKFFLLLLSFGYGFGVFLRNLAFTLKLLKTYKVSVPVISVGNIVAGGSGKTPCVMFLVRKLQGKYKVAILSRGYGSKAAKGKESVILCEGNGSRYSVEECGDEPYMVAENFPEVLYIVGKNRCRSADLAVSLGAEIIILDDGFQHRYLHRDLDIVVIGGIDPWGGGHLLPRGFLRENIHSLSRADLIVVNSVANYQNIEAVVTRYSSASIVGVEYVAKKIFSLTGEAIESLQGRRVGVFCGIGQPKSFIDSVCQQGAEIVAELFLVDHGRLTLQQIKDFTKYCRDRGAEMLVCTEKDKVKLNVDCSLPVAWIQGEMEVKRNETILQEKINL